ncbi:MAG: thiolase family protein, partial [Pedococcus sp.]
IVAARRTPIGTTGHALRQVPVDELAAPVLQALSTDVIGIPGPIGQVVLGNCMGPGGNTARVAALAAGLPIETPGLTVDLQCGSGLAAITTACSMVRAGMKGAALAGGAESASTAPWRLWPPAGEGQEPRRYTRAPFAPVEVGDPEMGRAADALSHAGAIGRERQDRYAARSHQRAAQAQAAGRFAPELVTVGGLDRDERVRPGMSAAKLARLRPAFSDGGTVTAGNSCAVSDGAAAVAIVDAQSAAAAGMPGLACVDWAICGVDPNLPGLGPVPAIETLLQRNRLRLDDLGVIEINEAFAGQVLACCDALGLDEHRVCHDGGALALGHPWGASGAVLAVRLFTQMAREDGPDLGLAAIAVGGGIGVALLVERVR